MKKIILILFLLPLVTLSQSKKELKNQKKELKKLELKITNRGLNLQDVFVPYYIATGNRKGDANVVISNWSEALLESGLNVGTYHTQKEVKDAENREMELTVTNVIKGRYIFESSYGKIAIKDTKKDNQLVASIRYKENSSLVSVPMSNKDKAISKRLLIISELIKSNK